MAQPRSALDLLLKPGRYPRGGDGAINLVIQEQPNVAQIQLIARKGQGASLARRVSSFLGIQKTLAPREGGQADGIHIYATGPLEYWVFSAKHSARLLEQRLADELGDSASLFDHSHARFVVRINGDDATGLLAKGTSLDLDESAFPAHGASHSTIEHIPALVARRSSPPCFELSVPRSYAGSLLSWLAEAAQEFGYILK
ncbi:MAG: sarcosine oxidase subunit gamma [Alphaproteobacteria bacterium]